MTLGAYVGVSENAVPGPYNEYILSNGEWYDLYPKISNIADIEVVPVLGKLVINTALLIILQHPSFYHAGFRLNKFPFPVNHFYVSYDSLNL